MATADKRALRELPRLEQAHVGLRVLRGRIICFEQIFKLLCKTKGLKRVREAVVTAPRADEAISLAYDQLSPRGDRAFMAGMDLIVESRVATHAPGWLARI